MIQWIRQSNLIEGVDDPQEDWTSERAWADLQQQILSVRTILDLHYFIMQHQRPEIAGKFRRVEVTVGGYEPPKPSFVRLLTDEWVRNWSNRPRLSRGQVQESHIQFEKIHPFEDGNGRVGRMLMNWMAVKNGIRPFVILANYRQEYYKWFR